MHRMFLLATACLISGSAVRADRPRPNVLLIAVDDLRPELGCYGKAHMHTPNMDRLAARGIVFERAYCMVPTCGASRASLMSGLRPARNRFVTWQASVEAEAPGIIALNTHFKDHGYHTVSIGKVFHLVEDNAAGWSEPPWRPGIPTVGYHLPENQKLHAEREEEGRRAGRRMRGPSYEAADVPEEEYWDGILVQRALQDLQRLSAKDQPFFLAVGFVKPHLPFVAPKKYWDLYDRESSPLPETYRRPKDAPDQAIHNWNELRAYSDVPSSGPLTDEHARALIHGYYACVSHVDGQVGKLLDEIDRLGLAENTILVFWGDHGWNLGEHTLWCKHSCFEISMRVPLIVAAPGLAGGRRTNGLTESIDIYPSLCGLSGLPLPGHLEGRSFVPLIKDPDQQWKSAAIGRFNDGDTIRTHKYRFTEYTNSTGSVLAKMLYNHQCDPQEDVNISDQPASWAIVERLSKQLREGMGKN